MSEFPTAAARTKPPAHSVLVQFVLDGALAFLAYVAAFWIRSVLPMPMTAGLMDPGSFFTANHAWGIFAVANLAGFYFSGAYGDLRLMRKRMILLRVAAGSFMILLVLAAYRYFTKDDDYPASVFPVYAAVFFVFATLEKFSLRHSGGRAELRVLVVGHGDAAREMAARLAASSWPQRRAVEIVEMSPEATLEQMERLQERLHAEAVDEVVLVHGPRWEDRLMDRLLGPEAPTCRVFVAPSVYDLCLGKRARGMWYDWPLLEVSSRLHDPAVQSLKRLCDAVVAGVALTVLWPVFAAVAVAIRRDSPGPAFYVQTRVGLRGRLFRIVKFRTMRQDAESRSGPTLSGGEDDPRITPLGRFLRRWHIDELPQLWNVLLGDMSLVGPRPERPEIVESIRRQVVGYDMRHEIRPGVTGLAQLHAHYDSEPADKLRYDLLYLYNFSLLTDAEILARTAIKPFLRPGTRSIRTSAFAGEWVRVEPVAHTKDTKV